MALIWWGAYEADPDGAFGGGADLDTVAEQPAPGYREFDPALGRLLTPAEQRQRHDRAPQACHQ